MENFTIDSQKVIVFLIQELAILKADLQVQTTILALYAKNNFAFDAALLLPQIVTPAQLSKLRIAALNDYCERLSIESNEMTDALKDLLT